LELRLSLAEAVALVQTGLLFVMFMLGILELYLLESAQAALAVRSCRIQKRLERLPQAEGRRQETVVPLEATAHLEQSPLLVAAMGGKVVNANRKVHPLAVLLEQHQPLSMAEHSLVVALAEIEALTHQQQSLHLEARHH
jgi:hypothetical protein